MIKIATHTHFLVSALSPGVLHPRPSLLWVLESVDLGAGEANTIVVKL